MQYLKPISRLRQISLALFLLVLALGLSAGAKAQITQVTQKLTSLFVNNPRSQFYPFSYSAGGSSLWGPGVPGTQTIDFNLPLVSPTWSQNLGYFFNPCYLIDCTFGAGFQANISANTSIPYLQA